MPTSIHSKVRAFRYNSLVSGAQIRVPNGYRLQSRTVTKADLDEHVITHDDRKTFRCEEYGCNAAYKCQKSLKKHVDMVHYGYGPSIYACHLCKNTYRSGTNLSKHLAKIHHLRRAPGFNRNVYRAGEDGIYRLHSTNEADTTSTSITPPEKSISPKKQKRQNPKPRKILPKPSPLSDESDDTQLEEDEFEDPDQGEAQDDQDPETFTSYEIAKVQALSKAKIAIELRPGEELPAPQLRRKLPKSPKTASSSGGPSPSPPPCPTMILFKEEPRCDSPESSSASASHPVAKNIDDFTVMRRYLKVEKPVVISYEETDATGSVIRSEMVQTSEISRDQLGKNDLN